MAPQTSLAELCAWWMLRCSSWSMLNRTRIHWYQQFDTVDWVTGRASHLSKSSTSKPQRFFDRPSGTWHDVENGKTKENIKQKPKPVVAADLCVRTNVRWMWLNVERRSDDADADITVKSTSSQHVPTPVGQSSSTVAVSFVWYLMLHMTGFPSLLCTCNYSIYLLFL